MYNFGNINNAFSELLIESYLKKDSNKKTNFNAYLKAIKESPILRTQYSIYRNISEKHETNDIKVTEFIKETISLMDKFKLSDIIKENKKIIDIIGDSSKLFKRDYTTKKIHEDIDTLIMLSKNKSPKNIEIFVESFNNILEFIKRNEIKSKEETISESVLDLAIAKFNEKYSQTSENEKKIIKSLISSDNKEKEEILVSNIRECIDLIDNKLTESDIEIKDTLLKVKDKIMRISFNEDSFTSDISKIIELKNDLS